MVVVGERRRDIPGWLIETLVAFLGDASFVRGVILLHLGPQGLITWRGTLQAIWAGR